MKNIQPSPMAIKDSLVNYANGLHKVVNNGNENPVYSVFHAEKDESTLKSRTKLKY